MTGQSRMDKWLWHARFFRTRALAQRAAASGLVRLNGRPVDKPGHWVRLGDVVTVPTAREAMVVRIVAIAERRGRPQDAQRLYEIVAEP
ncbi:MAG: RNA-binding S4 domain-containing protein [Alphaproteobacteria bacterium]|nr:RNA-binding S4 domain-containing protein [Alphaproteobacteria bacterium]